MATCKLGTVTINNGFLRMQRKAVHRGSQWWGHFHEEDGTSLGLKWWLSIRQMKKKRKVGGQKWSKT